MTDKKQLITFNDTTVMLMWQGENEMLYNFVASLTCRTYQELMKDTDLVTASLVDPDKLYTSVKEIVTATVNNVLPQMIDTYLYNNTPYNPIE